MLKQVFAGSVRALVASGAALALRSVFVSFLPFVGKKFRTDRCNQHLAFDRVILVRICNTCYSGYDAKGHIC